MCEGSRIRYNRALLYRINCIFAAVFDNKRASLQIQLLLHRLRQDRFTARLNNVNPVAIATKE